jgi:eukaryotic-like serine/threonine-protein kinase
LIAGRYTLDREIGRGGMGAVWLGRDEVLGRAVALKRIGMAPGASGPDLERAEREARLAARLNHPHVVAVFDLVTEDERQWLVMEYVENVTLAQLVRDDGALTPDRAAPLLVQAADALAAAHAAGIVHRDVKPSNILVTRHGQVKLSDFGIARAEADASLTQTGLVTGSPAYLAPEVAAGGPATDASDVWSLGATLYHALAGRPPYDVGQNLMGALYRIVHEDPPRLEDAGWLAPLLEATMTREPADRWSMARVRDFLQSGPAGASARPAPATAVASDPARTQVLSAPVPPADTTYDTTAAPPAPVSPDRTPAPTRHRRIPWVPLVAGLALVLVLGLVTWAVLGGDDETKSPAAQSSADNPSGGASSASQQPDRPTADGMETFIQDYLATVTTDPQAAFAMLTPSFQAASGGIDGYRGFWDTIRTATVTSFSTVDPGTLTVGYTVDYTRTDGSTAQDDVSLQLVYQDGDYLIDGEA